MRCHHRAADEQLRRFAARCPPAGRRRDATTFPPARAELPIGHHRLAARQARGDHRLVLVGAVDLTSRISAVSWAAMTNTALLAGLHRGARHHPVGLLAAPPSRRRTGGPQPLVARLANAALSRIVRVAASTALSTKEACPAPAGRRLARMARASSPRRASTTGEVLRRHGERHVDPGHDLVDRAAVALSSLALIQRPGLHPACRSCRRPA